LEGRVTAESVLASEYGSESLGSVVASSLRDGVVYAAVRSEDGTRVDGLVVLVERTADRLSTKGLWEDIGPYRDACPARILDLLTETSNEHALAWRARCRARLSRPKPQPGDVIVFPKAVELSNGQIHDRLTFRGRTRLEDENGQQYRVPGWRQMDFRIERAADGEA